MLGDIIGAGIGAIGSIFGGMSASKAMKNVKKNVAAQKQANQNWFDRRYNEDATQRADAQSILTRTEEALRARNKAAEGAAAVMGGTEKSVAAETNPQTRQELEKEMYDMMRELVNVLRTPNKHLEEVGQ